MREGRRVILEALLIALVGLILGIGVNAINEDGLTLTTNYFAKAPPTTRPAGADPRNPTTTQAATGTQNPQPTPSNPVEAELLRQGIGIAHHNDVKAMLADPLYGTTLFLIDARDDEHYQAGHIDRAHQVDHYHIERYLPQIIDQLRIAQRIIVYCGGGECEDSKHTAFDLLTQGVDVSKIFVYTGGYKDWAGHKESVEKGDRGSGNFAPAAE